MTSMKNGKQRKISAQRYRSRSPVAGPSGDLGTPALARRFRSRSRGPRSPSPAWRYAAVRRGYSPPRRRAYPRRYSRSRSRTPSESRLPYRLRDRSNSPNPRGRSLSRTGSTRRRPDSSSPGAHFLLRPKALPPTGNLARSNAPTAPSSSSSTLSGPAAICAPPIQAAPPSNIPTPPQNLQERLAKERQLAVKQLEARQSVPAVPAQPVASVPVAIPTRPPPSQPRADRHLFAKPPPPTFVPAQHPVGQAKNNILDSEGIPRPSELAKDRQALVARPQPDPPVSAKVRRRFLGFELEISDEESDMDMSDDNPTKASTMAQINKPHQPQVAENIVQPRRELLVDDKSKQESKEKTIKKGLKIDQKPQDQDKLQAKKKSDIPKSKEDAQVVAASTPTPANFIWVDDDDAIVEVIKTNFVKEESKDEEPKDEDTSKEDDLDERVNCHVKRYLEDADAKLKVSAKKPRKSRDAPRSPAPFNFWEQYLPFPVRNQSPRPQAYPSPSLWDRLGGGRAPVGRASGQQPQVNGQGDGPRSLLSRINNPAPPSLTLQQQRQPALREPQKLPQRPAQQVLPTPRQPPSTDNALLQHQNGQQQGDIGRQQEHNRVQGGTLPQQNAHQQPGGNKPDGNLPRNEVPVQPRPIAPLPRRAAGAQEDWLQAVREGPRTEPQNRAIVDTVRRLLEEREVIDAQLKGLYDQFGKEDNREGEKQ